MSRNSKLTRRTFSAGLGAAGFLAGTAPFSIGRAQGAKLKVGVLLPRSGYQAGIGQDCQRGVDITNGLLKQLGMGELEIMNGDTETNVDVARSRAEKLIADGAQLAEDPVADQAPGHLLHLGLPVARLDPDQGQQSGADGTNGFTVDGHGSRAGTLDEDEHGCIVGWPHGAGR